jgi:MFS family permease
MRGRAQFFYGWVVVASSAVGLLFGAFPIAVSSFAVFFRSYSREFHAGRGAISLALTIYSFIGALLSGWIGRLTDRFGGRKVILTGLAAVGAVLLSAQAIGSRLWQLYVFYAILGAVSGATVSVPYGMVVSRWFNQRRGLALGLALTGLGAGAIVMPPLLQFLIASYGWRPAFAIAGGVVLIIPMPVVALFLKESPRGMGLSPDGAAAAVVGPDEAEGLTWREIRNGRTFWVMVAAFVLASAAIFACTIHIAELLSDRGASPAAAALAVSIVGLALLIGRAGTGFVLDRYFGPHVALVIFLIAAVGIVLLWNAGAGVFARLGAFLVGLGLGAEVDIIAYLMSRYFGLRSLGTAFGFAFGAFVLASGLGPLVMGFAFDRTGSYDAPLVGSFIAIIVAAGLMASLGPYSFGVRRKVAAAGVVTVNPR